MLFSILELKQSIPAVVAQSDERHAKEQVLYWSGMTDTEHTRSGSNEEEEDAKIWLLFPNLAKFNFLPHEKSVSLKKKIFTGISGLNCQIGTSILYAPCCFLITFKQKITLPWFSLTLPKNALRTN